MRPYTAGKSCGPGMHAYEPVAGRRYERCPACGSTRTVKATNPGAVAARGHPAKAGQFVNAEGHLVNGGPCPKCKVMLAARGLAA